MTTDEFAAIARAARIVQLDQELSPARRRVAQSLYELASILTNPDYGCTTETFAGEAMYRHLQRTAHLH